MAGRVRSGMVKSNVGNVRIGQRYLGFVGLSLKRIKLVGVLGFSREIVRTTRELLWAVSFSQGNDMACSFTLFIHCSHFSEIVALCLESV